MFRDLAKYSVENPLKALARRVDEHDSVDVIVVGSANVDYMCYVPKLPQAGETIAGSKCETCFGGKGANQCIAAAKLGARTALVAKMGKDVIGESYMRYLEQHSVNVEHVELMANQSTGMAQIAVSADGENHIIIVRGANAMLNAKSVDKAKKLLKNSKVLLCQLETNVEAALHALRCFKGISIVNLTPVSANLPAELFTASSIVCVNKVEAAQIVGCGDIKSPRDAREAAVALLDKGANSVIITMGSRGAVYISKVDRTQCVHVAAKRVSKVVDTTGAGDAFIGGLAYYLARFPNARREQHIAAANAIAAHAIQRHGTQPSFPSSESAIKNICLLEPESSVINGPEEPDDEATA